MYMVKAYEKILLRTELLFLEIIDGLVDERKYRNRTDFVNEAIKEKILSEGIGLEPKEKLKLEEWCDF